MSLLKRLNLKPTAAMQAGKPAARRAETMRTKQSAGAAVETMEFEPEEIVVPVSKGLPGDSGEQQIKDLLQGMRDDLQDYWAIYTRGLDSFETAMSFASDQEAEPQHLQVALKVVAKKALDIALDEAGKKLGGPWGKVIGTAKAVAEAWAAESERAAAAAGQVKIRDYIISIRNGISAQQKAMTAVIEAGKQPLIEEYRRLAEGDVAKGKASADGVIVGQAAGLVNALRQAVQAFKAKMPSESYFQQQFSRNFADTPGRSDYVSHGGVPTGKIYFGLSIYVDPTDDAAHPKWKVEGRDSAWKLVTKAPKPDRVASSLMVSLGSRKPWEVELEKMVKLSVEIEESFTNSVQEGWIVFTKSPDQYEVRSNYGPKWFDLAWKQPGIRAAALDNAKLIGGSDY